MASSPEAWLVNTENSVANSSLAFEIGIETLSQSPAGENEDACNPLDESHSFTAAVVAEEGATNASTCTSRMI